MAGAGAKKFAAFSKLASDDVNNYLADQVIMRFATTTARDAAFGGVGEPTLAEGMTAYIDADNSIYTYDGSNWVEIASTLSKAPRGMVAYAQSTTTFAITTTETVATGMTVTFTAVAGRNYRITYFEPDFYTGSTNQVSLGIRLTNASGTLYQRANIGGFVTTAQGFNSQVVRSFTAGSITIVGTLKVNGGSGTATRQADEIAFIMVEDVGLA